MEAAEDSFAALTSLIRVAVHSDDPTRLIAAAGLLAGRPIALAGPHGETLGYVPDGSDGRRALAVARAAARNRLVGAAGWSIVPIRRASSSLGFLAIGSRQGGDAMTRALVDMLPELVAEQLHRVALLRAHRDAFVRRLVSDPRFSVHEARREARELRIDLTDAYWPAIVSWHGTAPPLPVLESLAREALTRVEGSLAALLPRRIVLLYPGSADADRDEPFAWLGEIVAQARALAPSFPAQAIAGEEAAELARLSAHVAELETLRRLGPRVDTSRPVVPARDYALERLFWADLDVVAARRFVDEQLARLTTWDREHRSDLLSVLEAALDFPRQDQAASSCFMHRNTFRHRLQQAADVLGSTLEDPDERLAVHVALKLRRLLTASSLGESVRAPRSAPPADGRWSKRRSTDSLGARAARPLSRRR